MGYSASRSKKEANVKEVTSAAKRPFGGRALQLSAEEPARLLREVMLNESHD